MKRISKTEYHIIRNTFVDNLEREVGQKIDDSLFVSIDDALGDTLNVDWDDEREVELEKDIKNDLYGTEVYGESEVG
tara:strand:+ start:226 stop:456 length:231 start_codon:yes stop_codon:yes gene_type:complete